MTKTTSKKTMMIASITIASLLIGTNFVTDNAFGLPAIGEADDAKKFTKTSDTQIRDYSEVNAELPSPHTKIQLDDFERKALENAEVAAYLGTDYQYKSSGKYGTDAEQKSQISFFTDNQSHVVTIVFENGEITNVDKYKTNKWSTLGFAIDYYSGSQSISGLQMRADVPAYTHDSGDWVAMLVNAQKDGSDGSKVCNSSEAPDHYWAQAGMQFDTNGVRVGWTDTLNACSPTFLGSFSFSTGDELKYRIYIDDTEDEWYVWIDNVDDGAGAFVTDPIEVANSSILDTSERHTSVWFESQNGSTTWEDGFSSDPDVNSAHYQKASDGNWYFWDGETQIDWACSLGFLITGTDLMDGTFVGSPHDVTFDVSEIEYYCD